VAGARVPARAAHQKRLTAQPALGRNSISHRRRLGGGDQDSHQQARHRPTGSRLPGVVDHGDEAVLDLADHVHETTIPELEPWRRAHSGLVGKRGLREAHYDPAGDCDHR
jgi:hypothetical protein